ncbi:ABC transporter permease [Clostridium sp.]|uniref:ABC transporter permease n=1 Tax=Clostridium sp. TaxID=1506 RepID=UPI001A5E9D1C|nr:ABC transporter permease subunit [Clostridium sp.]MBK5241974.1 ABC transporter permease subunit [Clostridium sp.]
MKSKILNSKIFRKLFWSIILIIIWQIIYASGKFSPLIFPSVLEVVSSLCKSIASGEIIYGTIYSLELILKGLSVGLILAVILSSLAVLFKPFSGLVETLVSIAHPLPGIALLPLIILWFGAGEISIIFIIVHSVVWPLVLNLLTGFKSIPNIYKQVGNNYGLNSFEIIRYIMIPASMPYFLTGMRISWARSWRALISAEMIFGAAGGKGGLGFFIFKNRVFMDITGIFAGLIVIVVIGMIVEDLIFDKVEKVTIKKWGMTI